MTYIRQSCLAVLFIKKDNPWFIMRSIIILPPCSAWLVGNLAVSRCYLVEGWYMYKPAILWLTIAILISWAPMASAAIVTIYTDKTGWENAVSGQFLTENFTDDILNTGVSFISSESGHINPAQECYQDVLASQSQNEPMTTWSFVPAISAYGGNWTLGGPGGSGNNLLVYIADSSFYVGFISNSYNGGFWGFTSDTPFTSVRLVGGTGTNQQNYSLDDMVYSPIPEPTAVSLLAPGGVLIVRRLRRR